MALMFLLSFSFFLLSKEIARVQYDDDNYKETSDYFVLPSRTIMNYQARLSFSCLVSRSLSLFVSFIWTLLLYACT